MTIDMQRAYDTFEETKRRIENWPRIKVQCFARLA